MDLNPSSDSEESTTNEADEGHTEDTEPDGQAAAELAGANVRHISIAFQVVKKRMGGGVRLEGEETDSSGVLEIERICVELRGAQRQRKYIKIRVDQRNRKENEAKVVKIGGPA